MMKTVVGLALLSLLGVRAWAFSFGTGCADACGVEEIVRGSTATCDIVVGTDGLDEPTRVDDVHYIVHHADGDEIVPAGETPLLLMPGDTVAFPAIIGDHPGDTSPLVMTAIGNFTAIYPGPTEVPFDANFGDQMAIIDVQTCFATTTTTVPQETTTTLPEETTTTTLPSRPECEHSHGHGVGLLRKCGQG